MFSVKKITDAGAAHHYFSEKDDYYLSDSSSAEWFGRGAERAGLAGEVDLRDFRDVLEGRIAGRQVGSSDRHAPGWDGTFSAPKSVSVAALVGGDKRLIQAHDSAVREALRVLEQHAAMSRQRGGGWNYVFHDTDNLTAAIFRHASNRNQEPQLHSHAVIANATYDPSAGKWVSLWSKDGIYKAQREAGAAYMNALAAAARNLGYGVEWTVNDKGHPAMELAEIPPKIREQFSNRTADIDAELARRGLTRATATAEQKEKATLATRQAKEHVPAAELHARWNDLARASGFDPASIRPTGRVPNGADRVRGADTAVAEAVAHLAERDARFTGRELMTEARVMAQGRASEADLIAAIKRAKERGDLLERGVEIRVPGGERRRVPGLTTKPGEKVEKSMLAHADAIARMGKDRPKPGEKNAGDNTDAAIELRIAEQEARTGHSLTNEHRRAVHGILAGESGLHILDGLAGTGKTTGVLAVAADHARDGGWKVRAMAPTSSAAATLGDAIGAKSSTVAAVVGSQPKIGEERELWIVDETGMVSAKDMDALLARARGVGATVVLVGDDKQIGSVGSGRAFSQLKAAHPGSTYLLTDIKRQRSAELKRAVLAAIRGDAAEALDNVNVTEQADRSKAVDAVADAYMTRVGEGKETLAVTLSRADRADVNAAIQQRREQAGKVTNAVAVSTLVNKSWTNAQKSDAARYQPGDVIEAQRDFRGGPRRGEHATVIKVAGGKVTAERANGKAWMFDPTRTNRYNVLDKAEARIGQGDRIVATGTIAGTTADGEHVELKNGTEMTVERIRDGHIDVAFGKGQRATIDARHGARIDLAYAQTANQAQGRTVDSVVGFARSNQTNLADQQRMYVTLSRAREDAEIITDNKERLANTIARNTGQKEQALEPGASVRAGDTIRTNEAIHATVRDGHAAEITAGTELHVDRVRGREITASNAEGERFTWREPEQRKAAQEHAANRSAAEVRKATTPGRKQEQDRNQSSKAPDCNRSNGAADEPAGPKRGDTIRVESGEAYIAGGGPPVDMKASDEIRVDSYEPNGRTIHGKTTWGDEITVYNHPSVAPKQRQDREPARQPTAARDRGTAYGDRSAAGAGKAERQFEVTNRGPRARTLKDLASDLRDTTTEAWREARREWKRSRRAAAERKFDRSTKRVLKDIDRREREGKKLVRKKYGSLSLKGHLAKRKVEERAAQARGKVQAAQLRVWADRERDRQQREAQMQRAPERTPDRSSGPRLR